MSEKILKKAINKHKAGQHSAAQQLYKKILKSQANHIDANYMLGTLLAETGQAGNALKYLNQAEHYAPDSQFVKNNLGNVYRMLGDYEKASNKYSEALSIQPDMTQALNNLAIVQRRLGHNDQAIALYKTAISNAPNFIEAHYNLGKSYTDEKQLDDARACFQRVLELNPAHELAIQEMGDYYLKRGDKNKAIDYFQQYLALADADICGAKLKLSYLNAGEMPERQPEQLIKQTYEKKARTWDEDVGRVDMAFLGPQHIARALEELALAGKELVTMDVGCGTGLCAPSLKECSSLLHGIDLSPDMLALANRKELYDELFCDDITHHFEKTKTDYDLIVGSGVMIFFGNLVPVLTNISAHTKTNGHFIFTLYQSAHDDIEIRDNMHFAHSKKYIEKVAKQSGFKVKDIKSVVHEYEYEQPQPGFLVSLVK